MNKKWLITGAIIVLVIATALDLKFQGLGYSLLPGSVQELADKIFR